MKDIRMVLPNPASDTAGAASALFSLGGLNVIHDAAGSMESYVTFDEARDLEDCRTVASRLSRLEAITGDDEILLDSLEQACREEAPAFIALIGSPVPFTIGMDLEGIAAEAEYRSGIPAFAVNSGGFALYDKGAGEALEKLLKKLAETPAEPRAGVINLLGATPLDYSPREMEGLCVRLKEAGAKEVRTLTMARGAEEIRRAGEAERNVVISLAGLPAARWLKKRFGTPYTVEVPLDWQPGPDFSPKPEQRVLVLGESVLTAQLVQLLQHRGVSAVAGVTAGYDPEVFPGLSVGRLDTEAAIRRELKQEYFALVGDPLYGLLLPPGSKTKLIARPHRALSARLYPFREQPLEALMKEIERCFA